MIGSRVTSGRMTGLLDETCENIRFVTVATRAVRVVGQDPPKNCGAPGATTSSVDDKQSSVDTPSSASTVEDLPVK